MLRSAQASPGPPRTKAAGARRVWIEEKNFICQDQSDRGIKFPA
jgi:hypothetical protein